MPSSARTNGSVDSAAYSSLHKEDNATLFDGGDQVVGLDSVECARLLRKLDWHLLPLVSLLYLLCFL